MEARDWYKDLESKNECIKDLERELNELKKKFDKLKQDFDKVSKATTLS